MTERIKITDDGDYLLVEKYPPDSEPETVEPFSFRVRAGTVAEINQELDDLREQENLEHAIKEALLERLTRLEEEAATLEILKECNVEDAGKIAHVLTQAGLKVVELDD